MLCTQAVEPRTLELLRELCSIEQLNKFALIGGTNLALRLGHRTSEDIDFFSIEKFNEDNLDNFINKKYKDVQTINYDKQTRKYLIKGIQVEFIRYNYPLLNKIEVENGIRMYSLEDTIAAKMSAVVQRGGKKDFYDLYELLTIKPLGKLLDCYKKRFNQDNIVPLLKSLIFFDSAENDNDPKSLNETKWEQVKTVVEQKVRTYVMELTISPK